MNACSYIFRIGITTAFVMPVFIFLPGLEGFLDISELLNIYIIGFLCECAWLVPALFVLWICASVVSLLKLRVTVDKAWLSFVLIVITYLPLFMIFGIESITEPEWRSKSYIVIHTLIMIALVWLYYLRIDPRPGINEADGEVSPF
jgi:hypothetical protein